MFQTNIAILRYVLLETLANVAGTKVIHGEATAQEKQGFSKATKALLDNQKSMH